MLLLCWHILQCVVVVLAHTTVCCCCVGTYYSVLLLCWHILQCVVVVLAHTTVCCCCVGTYYSVLLLCWHILQCVVVVLAHTTVCCCCVAGDAEGFGKEHVNQEAVEVDSAAVDVSVAGMTSQVPPTGLCRHCPLVSSAAGDFCTNKLLLSAVATVIGH